MKKLIILLISSIISFGEPTFSELKPFKLNKSDGVFNVIIVINQIENPIIEQPILNKILNKSNHLKIPIPYRPLIDELYENGYQVLLVSYLERNELYNPLFSTTHLFIQYDVRQSLRRLNQERKIYSEALELLDQFVIKEYYRRPLCVIFHMPPKQKYQLEIKNKNDNRTFEEKRDFSLVNLYHEIHKRRYLYPNKLLIYPSFQSKNVIIINNK